MTAADTPPSILVGGSEADRALLKTYLERNRLAVVGLAATLEEAHPQVLSHPEATLVLIHPSDVAATGSWVHERRGSGFVGRVGVISEPRRIPEYLGKGRWNDFVLKAPVVEADLCGAVRSSSRLSDRS